MALLEQDGTAGEAVRFLVGERPNVIVVAGELDTSNKRLLAAAIDDARAAGWSEVEIDLAKVSFMDSSALGVLVAASKTEPAGNIRVINASPNIRRLFEITDLTDIFHVE